MGLAVSPTTENRSLTGRSVETRADERALWLQRLLVAPVAALVDLVHGRLLPLGDLLSAAAAGQELPQGPALGALRMPYAPAPMLAQCISSQVP